MTRSWADGVARSWVPEAQDTAWVRLEPSAVVFSRRGGRRATCSQCSCCRPHESGRGEVAPLPAVRLRQRDDAPIGGERFQEESDARGLALVPDTAHPVEFVGAAGLAAGATLAATDQPGRSGVAQDERTEHRLVADEVHAGGGVTQDRPAPIEFLLVLRRRAEPNVAPEPQSAGSILVMFCGRLVSSIQSRSGAERIVSQSSPRHSVGTLLSNTSAQDAQNTRCRRPWSRAKCAAWRCHLKGSFLVLSAL